MITPQKINIKVQNQIVSVSVCKEDQPINSNKVKVTGTVKLESAAEVNENELKNKILKEKLKVEAISKKVDNDEETNEDFKNKEEEIEQSEQTSQSIAADQQLSSTDESYCPKKFRRQQYLSKSPRSENQENEIVNGYQVNDDLGKLAESDCNPLNNSTNSPLNDSLNTSLNAPLNSSLNLTTTNTPRKKRARSSVTTDESSNQIKMEEADCSIDEQVFSDDQNSNHSTSSFESQKKFLILKKLKSEQTNC